MKNFVVLLFAVSNVLVEAVSQNPVSRVVSLLKGLQAKLEKDLDSETDLFETYKCWHMSTTVTKKASNVAASSRIESLKTYIADIDAGKITFTTEALDLARQIKNLKDDLAVAKTTRASENKDFLAAEKEMEQAIAALKKSIKTIEDATKGSLAQTRSHLGMLSTRHSIQKAMQFSRGLLDAGDMKYLERLLNGDVPDVDWKKLNRKATFKSKYNKRSGKISDTLNQLQTTFENNLKEAIQTEKDAVKAYETLKTSKGDMLSSSEKAKVDMVLEGDARGSSKEESQKEVDALEAQVLADTKFITETDASFKIKTKEWEARKEMRSKEILAMSQAIAVLHSDDARDLMKSSYKSQGYFMLIQKAHTSESQQRLKFVARLVSSLASKSGDEQLLKLASSAKNDAIDKVVTKIDEIVADKKAEENADLEKKQKCEEDLSEAARNARKAALDTDTASEDIVRAQTKIVELKGEIKEQEEKKTSLEGQVEDITKQRERENEDWKLEKITDQKAVALVANAIEIMKDWKNAKDTKAALIISQKRMTAAAGALHEVVKPRSSPSLIQVHASSRQNPDFVTKAGDAPLPPPATWEGGAEYGGAQGAQNGIVGILEMVKEDITKDVNDEEAAEKAALKEFNEEKLDLENEIKATDEAIIAYKAEKAAKEGEVEDKKGERVTAKGVLDGAVELYKSYKPGCDFLLIRFDIRTVARQTEIDGLQKAKAILQGGEFADF